MRAWKRYCVCAFTRVCFVSPLLHRYSYYPYYPSYPTIPAISTTPTIPTTHTILATSTTPTIPTTPTTGQHTGGERHDGILESNTVKIVGKGGVGNAAGVGEKIRGCKSGRYKRARIHTYTYTNKHSCTYIRTNTHTKHTLNTL